jgi:folate-binding protein YgfZ
MGHAAWIGDRGLIKVSGPDAVPFLQGLISNDVTKVGPDRAIYAALLTPQGKFLHDFFITADGDGVLLDCEAERRVDLFTRLKRYRLRSKVELADVTEAWAVLAAWGGSALDVLGLQPKPGAATPFGSGTAYTDPRHAGLGARVLVAAGETGSLPHDLTLTGRAEYESLRLSLGIPSGAVDLPVEKAFLLESGFDELNGIDWQKGCYVGQEVTARTKYRGLLRRRLAPVAVDGLPPADDARIFADGRDVGELRSQQNGQGLALIRLDAIAAGARLTCGGATLTAHVPDWWVLPAMNAGDTDSTEAAG